MMYARRRRLPAHGAGDELRRRGFDLVGEGVGIGGEKMSVTPRMVHGGPFGPRSGDAEGRVPFAGTGLPCGRA